MRPIASVTRSGTGSKSLHDALHRLSRKDVLVGIPAQKASRRGEVNNAELLFIHTHGSALQHIPPRPVIEPAIEAEDNRSHIADELKQAAQAGLAGQMSEADAHLAGAGQVAANAAVRWFTDPRNGWAPNLPTTIKRKGSDRPLIDTGQLRRAITYVVEEG